MATNTAHTSSLDSLLPKLKHLEHAISEERAGQSAMLHALLADERLQRLEGLAAQRRTEFDAFDFIGELRLESGESLWASEEFHSNLLAWLLWPKQSHGLGDRFLKPFLSRAGAPQASQAIDWSAVKVIREWEHVVHGQQGYLDILILNEPAQVLCAIENKTFSSEHHEQLTRYRHALEIAYPTFARYHVFLTPQGTEPYRDEEKEYWQPLAYAKIRDILQQIVNDDDQEPNSDVRAFLRQYALTLRRNLVPDTSVSQLARQIWLEHREAMELLLANRPNWVAETKPILKEAIERQSKWKLDIEDSGFVRFRSVDWEPYKSTQTGSSWAPRSNALFLFEIGFYEGRPYLKLVLSRSAGDNDRLRLALFESCRQHPKTFRLKATSLDSAFTLLHEDECYMLDKSDYGVGWDNGTTRAKLEEWVRDFAETRFPAMNEIIVDCLRANEAKEQS